MVELYEAAKRAKEDRELIAAARREHAEFIQKTARLAAMLEYQDTDFHCNQVEAIRGQSSRVDSSGNQGDVK